MVYTIQLVKHKSEDRGWFLSNTSRMTLCSQMLNDKKIATFKTADGALAAAHRVKAKYPTMVVRVVRNTFAVKEFGDNGYAVEVKHFDDYGDAEQYTINQAERYCEIDDVETVVWDNIVN